VTVIAIPASILQRKKKDWVLWYFTFLVGSWTNNYAKKKRLLYMLGSAAPRAWIQHGNLWQRRLSRAADLWKLMVAVLGDLEI
jgi:hypothetical protein